MTNQKHLTLSDRMVIETQLSNSTSFKAIASALDKDPSTISKEVRSHLSVERIGGFRKSTMPAPNVMSVLSADCVLPATQEEITASVGVAVCAVDSVLILKLTAAQNWTSHPTCVMAVKQDPTAL